MKMICYIKQNNDAHTQAQTCQPSIKHQCLSNSCLKMLEDAEKCWKMLEDHSQSQKKNNTPVPWVACDRIDCCTALPGDGCALTTGYHKSRLKLTQMPLSSNEHHTMQVGLQMSATPELYRIINDPQFLLAFHRTHCESLCKTTGLVLGSNFLDLFNQMLGSSTVITCNYIMYVSLANKPHHRRTQQELQQELPASVRSTLHPPLSDKICKS